ncbi:MAG: DUF4177 domain-containing protein [Oscillospiraceae bacterium]|nr:DUF4177 domain-containing protein [Oscillospiraceae bacterium]
MKEYKMIQTEKNQAEKVMNDMAEEGWEVVTVTFWNYWTVSLLITFFRER